MNSAVSSNKGELTAAGIYAEHANFIRKIICSRVKDKDQADDIFQDLFLSLVASPLRPDIENVERYLYRLTINEIVNSMRAKKKIEIGVNRYTLNADIVNRQICPEDSVINADETAKMFRLMREPCSHRKEVSKTHFQALHLYYAKDFNIDKVAAEMGIKRNSASRYVSAGLASAKMTINASGENKP